MNKYYSNNTYNKNNISQISQILEDTLYISTSYYITFLQLQTHINNIIYIYMIYNIIIYDIMKLDRICAKVVWISRAVLFQGVSIYKFKIITQNVTRKVVCESFRGTGFDTVYYRMRISGEAQTRAEVVHRLFTVSRFNVTLRRATRLRN